MISDGDALLARILSGEDNGLANQLLSELFAGYPVEKLRLLLRSENIEAAKAGAWIASELGEAAGPLVDDLVDLLAHPSKYVRFYVVDAMRLGAGTGEGRAIASTVELLVDPESAVRWKTMNFIARCSREQIVSSLPYLERTSFGPLLQQVLLENRSLVLEQMASGDELQQRFAASTAGRVALAGDSSLLEELYEIGPPEIQEFAGDLLKLIGVAQR